MPAKKKWFTSTATASQAACSAAPVKGGNLVYARQAGPVTLNPFFPTNGNGDIFADTLLYQGLVIAPIVDWSGGLLKPRFPGMA